MHLARKSDRLSDTVTKVASATAAARLGLKIRHVIIQSEPGSPKQAPARRGVAVRVLGELQIAVQNSVPSLGSLPAGLAAAAGSVSAITSTT
jgi:hypothetical protein